MKNKILLMLFLLFICAYPVCAEDFFDNYTGFEHAWDNQKPITNQEFEKAIDTLTEKQKKKDEKAKKRKIKKISGGGTSLHKGLEPMSEIKAQDILKEKSKDEGQLLNIPVNVIIDDKVLDAGFYNVFGEKDKKGDVYLSFYQSQYLMGKVKAYTTNNDFEDEHLDFVKMEVYDKDYIKIMYGSLEFNAYTYLRYLQN